MLTVTIDYEGGKQTVRDFPNHDEAKRYAADAINWLMSVNIIRVTIERKPE